LDLGGIDMMGRKRAFLIMLMTSPLLFLGALEIKIDTSSLLAWEPLTFPKIPEHTVFEVVEEDRYEAIKIISQASASALLYTKTFSLAETPFLKWRWKIENIFEEGNAKEKGGDDYPIRIYILFEYSRERVPFFERIQFELAKALYGEYPPGEVLNYVWANRNHEERFLPNAFTDRAMMIFSDRGRVNMGEWRSHKVNILEDFEAVFDRSPPDTFTLAIMGDSDNTQESSVSFVSEIILSDK